MICKICNKEFNKSFGNHLKTHNITSQEYYDKYLKQEGDGICPICGKETKFLGLSLGGYQKHCSCKCSQTNKETHLKREQTCIEKFNSKVFLHSDIFKQQVNNTINTKWDGEHWSKHEEIKTKKTQTCLDKFGVENISQVDQVKCKKELTTLDHYNVKNPFQAEECKEKSKITKKEKYGDENYNNREKINWKELTDKSYQTKRKNNTFNTSEPEENFYKFLINIFGSEDIMRNYNKDKRYPFACDFYIKSFDLFIELNIFPTHNTHFFNSKNINDIKQLEEFSKKNKKWYDNYTYVWSVSDVNKRNHADINGLNYIVLWNNYDIEEFKKFILISTINRKTLLNNKFIYNNRLVVNKS